MYALGAPDSLAVMLISQAYDSHCNLVLGEVEETIYTIDEEDDGDENVKVCVAQDPPMSATEKFRFPKNNQKCYSFEVRSMLSFFPCTQSLWLTNFR